MAPIAGPLPRRRHRRLRREAVPGSRALADPGSARMSAAASRPLSPVAPWTFEAALEHVESDPDLLAGLLELPRAERAPAVRPHSHRARPQRPRGARDAGSPPRGHRRAVEAMRAVDAARDIEHLGRQRLVRRYGRPPSSVSFARRTPWGWRRSRGSVTPRGRRSVQRRDAQHRLDRRLPEAPLSFPERFPPGVSQKDSPTPGARPWVLFYPVMILSARVERGLQGAVPRTARA